MVHGVVKVYIQADDSEEFDYIMRQIQDVDGVTSVELEENP